MAHQSQMNFFADVVSAFPEHFEGKVIDIGSLDINGGPHQLFRSSEYVGVDLGSGNNVTHVSRGEDVNFPDEYFDVAMSSECFEHNREWTATLANMIRMTRESGLIVFTAASTGRLEHGTSRSDGGFAAPLAVGLGEEWYRNLTPKKVNKEILEYNLGWTFCQAIRSTSDLLFLGMKGPITSLSLEGLQRVGLKWGNVADSSQYGGSALHQILLQVAGDRGVNLVARARRVF